MRLVFSLLLALTFIALGVPASAQDGPFGVRMGMSIDQLPGCMEPIGGDTQRGLIFCDYLPKMHPDMESYFVYAYPLTGVCSVFAHTKTMDDDSAARKVYRKIVNQMSQVYGSPPDDSDDEIVVWYDGELYLKSLDMISVIYGVKSTQVHFTFNNHEKCEAAACPSSQYLEQKSG